MAVRSPVVHSMAPDPPPSGLKPFNSFRFFALPSEIRNKILSTLLIKPKTIDLIPSNTFQTCPRLLLFLVSKRMHEEAYAIFYGYHTFRIFPTHPRFYGCKTLPLIAELSSRYRAALLSLELRLSPGWGHPPKSWRVTKSLGLEDMVGVRVIKVFVECDPSDEVFDGFRIDEGFYTEFCCGLLRRICERLPVLETVYFDGYPSVRRKGKMMENLRACAEAGKRVVFARHLS